MNKNNNYSILTDDLHSHDELNLEFGLFGGFLIHQVNPLFYRNDSYMEEYSRSLGFLFTKE